MSEHTSLPWEWYWNLKPDSLEAECGIQYFDGNMAYSVARCPKYQAEQQWKADARFIVLACNHHEELVSTIKDFLDAHIAVAKRANFDGCGCEWCKAFHALLAKIEGGK